MAANTEFVNTKLVDLFSTAKGPSPFMVKNAERINKIVQQGIFQNQTTQQIASDLQTMAAKITRSEASTIARTSIQTFNNTTNNDVWSANEHLIDKWEWVAALDSKTCPICAPEDGQVRDKRRDFPRQPPAHPNCRCQILPYWEDQAVRQRPAQQVYKEEQSGARAYKTQVKVKGEKFYRKAVDVQPVNGKAATYADFIAKANSTTKQTFFGGGNAGRVRAERFDALNARYKDPQRALNALVDTSTGGFKKLDRLPSLSKTPTPKQAKAKPAPKASPKPAATPAPKGPKSLQQEGKDVLSRVAPELNSFSSIERKFDAVIKRRTQAMIDAKTPEEREAARKAYMKTNAIQERAAAKVTKAMEKVRKEMLKTNLPENIQKEYLDGINFAGWGTKKKLVNDTKKDVKEFIQMFNGQGFTATGDSYWVRQIEPDLMGRGYNQANGKVAVRIGSKENLFHELMHTVERQRPSMGKEAREWILSKSYGLDDPKLSDKLKGKEVAIRNGKPLFKLSDLTGSSYGDQEVAWKDDFINAYMGKDYGENVTEVWTVAVEHFTDSRTMGTLFRRHPDLFRMIVGLSKRY